MTFKSFLCTAMALVSAMAASAAADLTEGAVYRFTNKHDVPLTITAPEVAGNIRATVLDEDDKKQLWVVEHVAGGTGFHLRDLRYGTYMTSPIHTSSNWFTTFTDTPSPTTMAFILTDDDLENTAIQAVGFDAAAPNAVAQNGYAHANGGTGNTSAPLVCWGPIAQESRWAISLVDMPQDEIDNYRASWPVPSGQIEANRVYHLTNLHYNNGIKVSGSYACGTPLNTADKGQLWLTEEAEGGLILRNYKTGGALRSSRETSAPWIIENTLTPEGEDFTMHFEEIVSGYKIETLADHNSGAGYRYAHEDGYGNVVCWTADSDASFWAITLMEEITEADIAEQRARWSFSVDTEAIAAPLAELFEDKACTVLAPTYAAMTLAQIQESEAYQSLPETLQQMVIKVKTDNWTETDPQNAEIQWDSEHARKFRVQMYEPYSECGSVAALTCIQAYTNLNNPTGILGDDGSTIYIMVDKAPGDGSTLYIAPRTYEDGVDAVNRTTDGTELHEGLNVINVQDDAAMLDIYYTVTTNEGRTRLRPVSDFDAIKIHIEGGSINGLFNCAGDDLYTPDTNDDWFYYRERARYGRLPLISKHCILYFDFLDVTDAKGNTWSGTKNLLTPEAYQADEFDLVETMNAWDDMFVAELLVMGLLSDNEIRAEQAAGRDWYEPLEGDDIAPNNYHLYFNNRLMGITEPSGYMSATWFRTTYHVNTMEKVVMNFPRLGADDLWGPAHEFGHMNQAPMNIAGCTEESNNVFSNVALFYRGSSTSRADYPYVQREKFNQGANFHEHDTWGTTRMWFQLWLYYHAAGNNKRFYPRLYELLRQNPLKKNSTDHLNAKDDLLHFAKMACMAAEEDLTDFFDAWGFLQPQDGFYIGDYTSYTSYLSEEEIEEWRADIAQMAEEKGWKKNTAIIFIDDRVGSTKPSNPEFDKNLCGEMGGLDDFINGTDAVSGDYEFTLSGSTVTVSGATGGVGFLIYDEDGRLIGFANEHSFEVSTETGQKLISGQASISVVTSTGEIAEVTDVLKNASFDEKLDALAKAIARAEEFDSQADYSGKTVGMFKFEVVASLKAEADDVRALVAADEVTEENIDALLEGLNSELLVMENLPLNDQTTITVKDGGIYVFVENKDHGKYGIRASSSGTIITPVTATQVNVDDPAQQWQFEAAADGNGFYIRSISQDKYIGLTNNLYASLPLTVTPETIFIVNIHEPGFVSVEGKDENISCIHASANSDIVRWSDNEGSQWTLTLINDPELESARLELAEKIAATRALANELAENFENVIPIDLNDSHYSSNAAAEGTSWSVLYDNDPATFFATSGDVETADGLDHHVKIRLPEATTDEQTHLILKFRTCDDADRTLAPAEAVIDYSADDEEWEVAQNLTQKQLPALHNAEFESETFAVPAGTAYVRLTVSSSANSMRRVKARAAADHATFALSELTLAAHAIYCEPNVDIYPNSNAEDVTSALRQCHNSEVTGKSAAATSTEVKAALDAVEPHYQALLALKNNDVPTGLNTINAAEGSAAIFDLQGRKLSKANRSGLYIIGGKKVVKGSAD